MLPYLRRGEHHELGVDTSHGAGGPMVTTSARDVHPLATAFTAAGEHLGLEISGDLKRTLQLLMVSEISPQAHLREHGIGIVCDLPRAGANLHDHPTVVTMWPLTGPARCTRTRYVLTDC